MNLNAKLFLSLAKTILKYLMSEGNCRDFVARFRFNKIIRLVVKINDASPRMIPLSLSKTLIENKIELVDILGKLIFVRSGSSMRNLAFGVESLDLFDELSRINDYIEGCLFKLAKSAPDFIVRVNATQRINNQLNLIFLATDKNRVHEIRSEAVKRISDQPFLEALAADLREPYDLRYAALIRITDEKILRRIITNDKYDVVLLGVAHQQYKNIARQKKVPK